MTPHKLHQTDQGECDMQQQVQLPTGRSKLPREWFRQGAISLAPQLLGRTLVRRLNGEVIRAMIIETEAYAAPEDKASHAYGNRRTKRTETMFHDGGTAYIYLIYGMYHCLNVVAGFQDQAEAVLIRAAAPLSSADEQAMRKYRPIKSSKPADIGNGPGKLCRALQITKDLDDTDLIKSEQLWIEAGEPFAEADIVCAPRIGIPYAEEYVMKPWRFYVKDHPYVSIVDKSAIPMQRGSLLKD